METKKRIYTHRHVDLDAVISTCAVAIREGIDINADTVKFVPSDTTSVPEGVIAVDIQADKHADGRSYLSSNFAGKLPAKVIEEVAQVDEKGISPSFLPLQYTLLAVKYSGSANTDLDVVKAFLPIVKGWMVMSESISSVKDKLEHLPRIKLGKYDFLILENFALPFGAKEFLIDAKDIGGKIYKQAYGWGITRLPSRPEPDLSQFHLPGWFTHPKGFLFCWGSRKSPRKEKPPQFQNLGEFVYFIEEWLVGTT